MNIKKFLIVSCVMFQFSTLMYAGSQSISDSQSAYNAAFKAFDPHGSTDTIAQSAAYVSNNQSSLPIGKATISGTALYYAAQAGNTPQALAVAQQMAQGGNTSANAGKFKNADTKSNFEIALNVVQNGATPAPAPAPTPAPTPNPSTPVVTPAAAPTANQTNGNALQQQIEAAKALFNQYVPGTYTATPVIATASLPA